MTYDAENESQSSKPAQCISVDIPSTSHASTSNSTNANTTSSVSSSVSSSLAPSPVGILESRQSTTSTTSLPAPSLNVKFAPLPKLAPRKRRSLAPLGVAARSQMMRRRRGYDEPPMPHTSSPAWTDEEGAAHPENRHRQPRRQSEEELEDPFVTLGKMVKGAGKQLWRKVSNKEKEGKGEKGGKPTDKESAGEKAVTSDEPRHVLATIPYSNIDERPNKSEGGEGWGVEVGDTFPQDIGQTETIVEGFTKYSWASEVEAPPRSPEHKVEELQPAVESDAHQTSTAET